MIADETGMPNRRIASVDILRGAVMILMAIDHVRVYSGIPAGGPSPEIFFTRWITHFCAPAFVFLAGTSAFLGRRTGNPSMLLLKRGLWLIILELTVLRVAWTFNFDFASYEMAGVIWAIGWCMIILAGLVRMPPVVAGILGLIVIAGHNLLDVGAIAGGLGDDPVSALWKIVYVGFWAGPITAGPDGPMLIVLYSIIPWAGVMAAGYGFGVLLERTPASRDRSCYWIGFGAIVAFIVLRGFNLYGDPWPWSAPSGDPGSAGTGMPALLSFLSTNKYPASLLFLLMTLGPTVALMPLLERASGPAARFVGTFGRVPFFYYVLHIPLIHALALVVSLIMTGEVSPWLFMNHPMGAPDVPEGYTWSLWTLYAVWSVVILLLYVPCRWYAGLKAERREWWMKYV